MPWPCCPRPKFFRHGLACPSYGLVSGAWVRPLTAPSSRLGWQPHPALPLAAFILIEVVHGLGLPWSRLPSAVVGLSLVRHPETAAKPGWSARKACRMQPPGGHRVPEAGNGRQWLLGGRGEASALQGSPGFLISSLAVLEPPGRSGRPVLGCPAGVAGFLCSLGAFMREDWSSSRYSTNRHHRYTVVQRILQCSPRRPSQFGDVLDPISSMRCKTMKM